MGLIEAGIESESIIAYPEPACGRPNFSGVRSSSIHVRALQSLQSLLLATVRWSCVLCTDGLDDAVL